MICYNTLKAESNSFYRLSNNILPAVEIPLLCILDTKLLEVSTCKKQETSSNPECQPSEEIYNPHT